VHKITQTAWYQESVRISGLSGQKFSFNAILSLAMLGTLAAFACIAH